MSTTVILYPSESGTVLTRPVDLTIPLLELARGVTPAGVPFILVDESELPDADYFAAWAADFSEPDGYGIGPEAWAIERQTVSNANTDAPLPAVLAAATENAKKYNEAVATLNSAFQLPKAEQ